MRKKIMFLGGSFSQLPAIRYALQKGLHVITVDYLPDNPGHQLSHEYYNISTVEKEQILDLASRLSIDAISAYASDPSAPTAAYVSEKLGLVGSSYQSVMTLTDKGLFRRFLQDHGFRCPWHITASNLEEILESYREGKAVLKPVDSSGSKGISLVGSKEDLIRNFDFAMQFSRSGKVILEQYIDSRGPHLHGDGFVSDGELVFLCLGDHVYSPHNPFAPLATIAPSTFHQDIMPELVRLVQKAIGLAGFNTGGINVEAFRDEADNLWLMEIGARNGGNFIPQLMHYATGFDLVKANVDALLLEPIPNPPKTTAHGYFAQVILNSGSGGEYFDLDIPPEFQSRVEETFIKCSEGDTIAPYRNSGQVIGALILRLDHRADADLLRKCLYQHDWVKTR